MPESQRVVIDWHKAMQILNLLVDN